MQKIKTKTLTWVDIKSPTEKDVSWLKSNFKLHPLVLKEILPPLDQPKVENFGDYLFIVFFYPYFDKANCRTVPFELDIIVSKDYIITIHQKDILPLKALFDECNLYQEKSQKYTDAGSGELLYRILRELIYSCFPKLTHIKNNIEEIEERIFNGEHKQIVNQISLAQRDVIGFQRVIETQDLMVKELALVSDKFFGKKFTPYFRNLIGLYRNVEAILQARAKTLNSLDSTNQSLLTTKTNEIIQLLTIFSVIVFPLTLLAAIFGMNTKYLPLVGMKHDFWIVSGVMVLGAFIMLVLFKRKKWL